VFASPPPEVSFDRLRVWIRNAAGFLAEGTEIANTESADRIVKIEVVHPNCRLMKTCRYASRLGGYPMTLENLIGHVP
jgi:hypothetical protein